MEKLFLGTNLAGNKLNVINQQYVDSSEPGSKELHPFMTERINHFIHEFFCRAIAYIQLRGSCTDCMADGIEQMTFSQANAAVNKEGIIGISRVVSYCHCGCMCKLIARAAHKEIKGIFVIQRGERDIL